MSQLKIKDGNNSWINIPAGGIGVPSGGNQGDVLVKSSSADYATEWASPLSFQELSLTYTSNSYVTSTSFARNFVYLLGGRVMLLYFNTTVDGSSPGTTFRTIGKINLPTGKAAYEFAFTFASQSNASTLLLTIGSDGTMQIYSGGNATGFYRGTCIIPIY